MRYVFIHGMNQQHYSAASLKQYWQSLLKQGCERAGITAELVNLQCKFPFYADVLTQQHLSNQLEIRRLQQPLLVQQQHFIHPDAQQLALIPSNALPALKQCSHQLLQLAKHQTIKELTLLFNHFPKLHQALLQHFLVEAYLYLSNAQFIQTVHQRLLPFFQTTESITVVAHSLGTVIAYHFLRQFPQYRIAHLITLASPLAFRVIQENLPQPIIRPSNLTGCWDNFYSDADFISNFALKKPPFEFQPAITNHLIETQSDNPHAIAGYLQHPEVIRSIFNN